MAKNNPLKFNDPAPDVELTAADGVQLRLSSLWQNQTLVLADEPTASLDTECAFQVVRTFAALIHENDRAGIMVTHNLRMCQYVERVLQMRNGQLVKIFEDREAILSLARGE